MARIIGQRELRNENAKVIEAVAAGQTFVVTRNGTPIAELRPLPPSRPTFVARATLIEAALRGPHIDVAQFRADLDAAADQGL